MQTELDLAHPFERIDWHHPGRTPELVRAALWYNVDANPLRPSRLPSPLGSAPQIFLGTHRPNWLYESKGTRGRKHRPHGALFISYTQFLHGRNLDYPQADTFFAVDSGGYTELYRHGRWTVSALEYAAYIENLARCTGTMLWAAIQDWMCEDHIIEGGLPKGQRGGKKAAGTGLSVLEHQRRTIASYLELRALAPTVCWLPVLQGQTLDDYHRHIDMYAAAGVDLAVHALVGVGSLCRRQATEEIERIARSIQARVPRLHGFGVKSTGLGRAARYFTTCDSTAWSAHHRKEAQGYYRKAKASDDLSERARFEELRAHHAGLVNSQAGAEPFRAALKWRAELDLAQARLEAGSWEPWAVNPEGVDELPLEHGDTDDDAVRWDVFGTDAQGREVETMVALPPDSTYLDVVLALAVTAEHIPARRRWGWSQIQGPHGIHFARDEKFVELGGLRPDRVGFISWDELERADEEFDGGAPDVHELDRLGYAHTATLASDARAWYQVM